ncbi:hypothetical protein CY34DRAFT_802506 [Suillus luteus UH-Slu-Lm8-n1]|uniref:Uncharacterized protein n=1 Tax=Suillus luteus UH-Slu-Lm8-n1 TaxID=930992 RepID=A0A0D0A3N3_9AGAM|nr:hypothetical protein CY34DRAFT_802506 [Suillus luteus UH-Slu-Lm8-n1]
MRPGLPDIQEQLNGRWHYRARPLERQFAAICAAFESVNDQGNSGRAHKCQQFALTFIGRTGSALPWKSLSECASLGRPVTTIVKTLFRLSVASQSAITPF